MIPLFSEETIHDLPKNFYPYLQYFCTNQAGEPLIGSLWTGDGGYELTDVRVDDTPIDFSDRIFSIEPFQSRSFTGAQPLGRDG